ncbi:MAG: MoaD/ThiS family protein [Bacillota bacterium]
MNAGQGGKVEVRGFSFIKELFDRRGLPFPFLFDLKGECTAADLAERLDIPAGMLEAVFINGVAGGLEGIVRPGDRIAFVPHGTPGPYRVVLGFFKGENQKPG